MHFISKAIHIASPNKHLQVQWWQWQCVLKSVILYEVGLNKNRTPSSLHTFGVQDCKCVQHQSMPERAQSVTRPLVSAPPYVYLCAGD